LLQNTHTHLCKGASIWEGLKPPKTEDLVRGVYGCRQHVLHILSKMQVPCIYMQGVWRGTAGSFGTTHIENVLSACYVPALHYMAAPGDSCILTGFAGGQVRGCK